MRYGIIADIHGNLPALEEVLRVLAEADVDTYLCLGDIVGYGARPNECCELMRKLEAVCIRGNHEEAVLRVGLEDWFNPDARACLIWTREQLTEANREFLASLPVSREVSDLTLCHGSLLDPNWYITSPEEALPSLAAMSGALAFFGHTHYAEWFVQTSPGQRPRQHHHPEGGVCRLAADHKYLVNPGAVGQPRDRNPEAAFAVYDEEAGRIELQRMPYDITAAQEQMDVAGLPPAMALRLSLGT